MKIKVKPTQTLESLVACWQHLDMACPQHDPTIVGSWPQHHTWNKKNQNNGHGQEMIFHVHPFLVLAIRSIIVNEAIQGAFQSANIPFVVL